MGKRKIILFCIAVFLLAVYVVQIATSNKNTIKLLTLNSDDVGTINLSSKESGEITLTSGTDGWKVGKYKANENKVNQVLEQLKSIKILDTVSSSVNDATASLYGLDSENVISVKVWSGETLLRTIEVGKASVTGGQTYIRVDGEKAVCLASGSLASLFSSTVEQFRDNSIYSFATTDIEKVSITYADGSSFSVSRLPATQEGEASEWKSDMAEVDSTKVASWVSAIANLSASEWTDESDKSPLSEKATIEIKSKDKTVSVTLSEKGEDNKYLAQSSESPYRFKVTSYSGDNLTKPFTELLK